MDAGKSTISGVFNGSRLLEIPFYQRAYVWGEEQWERFLGDMEFVTASKRPYFLGSIILKQASSGNTWSEVSEVRTVIDGQQRLMHFVLGPSHDKTGIVVRLLQTERSISFDHFGNISDFHNPTTLFEKAIIFSTYHIRRSLVRGLCSHP